MCEQAAVDDEYNLTCLTTFALFEMAALGSTRRLPSHFANTLYFVAYFGCYPPINRASLKYNLGAVLLYVPSW